MYFTISMFDDENRAIVCYDMILIAITILLITIYSFTSRASVICV